MKKYIKNLSMYTEVLHSGQWYKYAYDKSFGRKILELENFLRKNNISILCFPKEIRLFVLLGFKQCIPSHGRHQVDFLEEVKRKYPLSSKDLFTFNSTINL